MRELLLGKPYGRVMWVDGLINLWPLFNEGTFVLVLLHPEWAETEEHVWSQFNTCHFRFGILAKRSVSGKKLFLKGINVDSLSKEEALSLPSLDSLPSKADSLLSEPKESQHEESKLDVNANLR